MASQTQQREDSESPADEDAEEPRRARLDRRTVVICLLVAAVAAVLSGVVAAAFVSNSEGQTEMGLTEAKVVPGNIAFTRFDGSKGTLDDYAGQNLVVNFFASYCVPCRKEMPALEQTQRDVGDSVTVLGLAVRDDKDLALELVERTGVTYDVAQDVTGDIMTGSGGTILPFTLFVAPDGTIMERHYGQLTAPELRAKISSNLLAGG